MFWGSEICSKDQFVLEEKNDAQHVLGWMIFKVLGLRPNLRWKSSFDGEYFIRGQLRLRGWFPISEEVQFNFISLIIFGVEPLY